MTASATPTTTASSSSWHLPAFLKVDYTWLLIAARLILVFVYNHDADAEWRPFLDSILVDPIYSVTHIQEARALRELYSDDIVFANAYSGNTIHLPPLVLAVVEYLVGSKRFLFPLVALVLDVRIAWNFQRLAETILHQDFDVDPLEEGVLTETKMDERLRPKFALVFPVTNGDVAAALPRHAIPVTIALLYLTVATVSNAYGSLQSLPLFCLLEALTQRSLVASSFFLAVATYLDVHCIIFLIPLVLLRQQQQQCSPAILLAPLVLALTLAFQGCNYLLVGGERYLAVVLTTHWHSFQLRGLEPSLSILWYFAMQVFRRFRLYFQLVLGGLPYCIVVPTTIRLYQYPAMLMAIFSFLGIFFRPPLTLLRITVGICFVLLNPRTLARMQPYSALVALGALPIPITLYLVTLWLWLGGPGTGEANFCFFQCLAANVLLAAVYIQICSAALRRDKALRYTRKLMAAAAGSPSEQEVTTNSQHSKDD